MKYLPIILFFNLLTFTNIFAQDRSEIDSLKILMRTIGSDSLAHYHLEIASLFYHLDRDSSLYYSESALQIGEKEGNLAAQTRAKINIALSKIENNQKEDASQLLLQALPVALKISDTTAVIMAYSNLGILNHYNADYKIAVDYYLKANEFAKGIGNDYEVSRLLYNIADVFNQNKLVEKKNAYYKEAMQYSKTTFPYIYVLSSAQIADYFSEINQDSAAKYLDQAFELEDQIQAPQILTEMYATQATILQGNSNYKDAETALLKALVNAKELDQDYLLSACYCHLGENAFFMKNYEQSTEYYRLFDRHHKNSENVYMARDCLLSRSMLEKAKGNNAKAYDLLYERTELMDSIYNLENRGLLADLESKYESTKKEAEIERHKAELDRKTYKQRLTTGGLGLSLLLGGSLVWGLLNRSKKNKKIAKQENSIKTQKIQTLEQEKKLLSMSSLLEGQENERIRIAKDLHDGLGGLLTTVKAHFGKIHSEIEKVEDLDVYNTANEMIDKAHDEVRRISHNLMPADLRVGGLPIAVRQLVHELRTIHEIKTEFELVGFTDDRLNEKVELTVYRITQELINNIIKYAEAKNVFIQLSKFEKEIQIVVEDEGQGFDYEAGLRSSGLGLKSIASRVEQMKGSMDVVSSPGKGTSVTANIPF